MDQSQRFPRGSESLLYAGIGGQAGAGICGNKRKNLSSTKISSVGERQKERPPTFKVVNANNGSQKHVHLPEIFAIWDSKAHAKIRESIGNFFQELGGDPRLNQPYEKSLFSGRRATDDEID